ncbi:hypothetical protein ABW20_dc0103442 [Dactylellina cionopaga]|nr:hypothetical protein ABW20_dc0103442 [Dactylellina cionopaga]
MQFGITAAAAIAILAFNPVVSGHCVIVDAYGDRQGSPRCMALGANPSIPRTGTDQPVFQEDTPVFASPAVPWTKPKCQGYQPGKSANCCKDSNCWPKVYYNWIGRSRVPTGCGVTLGRVKNWARQAHPVQYAQPWNKNTFKNVYYYQQPVDGSTWVDIPGEISQRINSNSLPVATAGGYLQLTLHQINSDGAGPFTCKVDELANGQQWSRQLTVSTNVPGNAYSINQYSLKKWPIVVQIPADINCQGTIGGQSKICVVRCENNAQNGPFGGCIPFQQWTPPPQQPAPPAPAPPVYNNNAGYTPVANNYQDGSEWTDAGNKYDKREINMTLVEREVARELDEENANYKKFRFMRD